MDAVFAFPGCCPSPQMESLVMRKIVGVGWREGSGRRAGGGSPAWSDINAKERSSLYARRRIHPAPDSIKTDLSPCETRCEDEGAEREREREREGKEIGWKREVEEVENIYLGETLFRGHWAAENLECLVIDGLNINVSRRRGSSNDSPPTFSTFSRFSRLFFSWLFSFRPRIFRSSV